MREGLTSKWFYLAALVVAAIVIFKAATRTVDFPVYYQTAHALLAGHGPLYGPESGLGWPSYFRYPPLFLLVFLPFALPPLKVSAAIWAALKCAVLYFLAREIARRIEYPRSAIAIWIPILMVGAFLIQEFRYGNAQFFIFALVAVALLEMQERPWLAALALALGVSLKVWPLFFVPYAAARRRWQVAVYTLFLVVVMTSAPAAYFGWKRNNALLKQWAKQEWGTSSSVGAIWYPSQSLRGVLTRYLTAPDYSKFPDKNYRSVQIVSLDPHAVRWIWVVLAAAGYLGLLALSRAWPASPGWLEGALAFCGLALLEPFTHRIGLVVLLWPAMIAGRGVVRGGAFPAWTRQVIYIVTAIFALEPLIPGAQSQRLFQVLGVDFFATCLLTAALLGGWFAEARGSQAAALNPHRQA